MNIYHPDNPTQLLCITETKPNANALQLHAQLSALPNMTHNQNMLDGNGRLTGVMQSALFTVQQSGNDAIITFPAMSGGAPSPLITAGVLRADITTAINNHAPAPVNVAYTHNFANPYSNHRMTWQVNGIIVFQNQLFAAKNYSQLRTNMAAVMSSVSNGDTWTATSTQFTCSTLHPDWYNALVLINDTTGEIKNMPLS